MWVRGAEIQCFGETPEVFKSRKITKEKAKRQNKSVNNDYQFDKMSI